MNQVREIRAVPSSAEDSDNHKILELHEFFPYLVRVFYRDVTTAIASIYQVQFGMTPAEWRSMVLIGPHNKLTANEIVMRSTMDKVTVSRAITRMKRNGWIETHANIADGRSKLISLSSEGKSVYYDLTPQALKMEQKLLRGISDEQKRQFISIMNQISASRRQI